MKILDEHRGSKGMITYREGPGGAEISGAASDETGKLAVMFSVPRNKIAEARKIWKQMTGRMPRRGRRR